MRQTLSPCRLQHFCGPLICKYQLLAKIMFRLAARAALGVEREGDENFVYMLGF